jgi:hypothetical protein
MSSGSAIGASRPLLHHPPISGTTVVTSSIRHHYFASLLQPDVAISVQPTANTSDPNQDHSTITAIALHLVFVTHALPFALSNHQFNTIHPSSTQNKHPHLVSHCRHYVAGGSFHPAAKEADQPAQHFPGARFLNLIRQQHDSSFVLSNQLTLLDAQAVQLAEQLPDLLAAHAQLVNAADALRTSLVASAGGAQVIVQQLRECLDRLSLAGGAIPPVDASHGISFAWCDLDPALRHIWSAPVLRALADAQRDVVGPGLHQLGVLDAWSQLPVEQSLAYASDAVSESWVAVDRVLDAILVPISSAAARAQERAQKLQQLYDTVTTDVFSEGNWVCSKLTLISSRSHPVGEVSLDAQRAQHVSWSSAMAAEVHRLDEDLPFLHQEVDDLLYQLQLFSAAAYADSQMSKLHHQQVLASQAAALQLLADERARQDQEALLASIAAADAKKAAAQLQRAETRAEMQRQAAAAEQWLAAAQPGSDHDTGLDLLRNHLCGLARTSNDEHPGPISAVFSLSSVLWRKGVEHGPGLLASLFSASYAAHLASSQVSNSQDPPSLSAAETDGLMCAVNLRTRRLARNGQALNCTFPASDGAASPCAVSAVVTIPNQALHADLTLSLPHSVNSYLSTVDPATFGKGFVVFRFHGSGGEQHVFQVFSHSPDWWHCLPAHCLIFLLHPPPTSIATNTVPERQSSLQNIVSGPACHDIPTDLNQMHLKPITNHQSLIHSISLFAAVVPHSVPTPWERLRFWLQEDWLQRSLEQVHGTHVCFLEQVFLNPSPSLPLCCPTCMRQGNPHPAHYQQKSTLRRDSPSCFSHPRSFYSPHTTPHTIISSFSHFHASTLLQSHHPC